MNKHYNLTEYAGQKVEDKVPDWINEFCKTNKDGVKKDIRDVKMLKEKKSIFDL